MARHFTKIVQNPDPVLRQITKDIKSVDNDVLNLLKDLKALAQKNSKEGITLVGLSAPQVGWSVSVFVYYDFKQNKYIDVINPKIVFESKETTKEWEGCASIGTGKSSLFGPVARARMAQIEFVDVHGNEQRISVNNYQSHVLLHEMDHLHGVLFIDKISDPSLIVTAAELDEYAKKHNGAYPPI